MEITIQIKKSIPVALWIAIIGMGIFAVVHLISSFSQPMQLIAFLTNLILLIGLYNGKKWAYIFTIIASIFIPLIVLLIDTGTAFFILILNSVVLIPLILSTKYFFPAFKDELQT